MRFVLRSLVVALALLLPAAPAALAQEGTPEAPAAVVDAPAQGVEAPVASASEEAVPPAGLPERAAPPRTLRDYWHVFAAFALTWLLLFGYVVSLGRRFARVESDLQRLDAAAPVR